MLRLGNLIAIALLAIALMGCATTQPQQPLQVIYAE